MAKQFFSSLPASIYMKRQNRKGHKNELVFSVLAAILYRQFIYVPSLNTMLNQTNLVDHNQWTQSTNSLSKPFLVKL